MNFLSLVPGDVPHWVYVMYRSFTSNTVVAVVAFFTLGFIVGTVVAVVRYVRMQR